MIRMKANDKNIEVDGKIIKNDVPPLNINDRTYVPIRFVAENMGLNVDWNEETEVVTIYRRRKHFDTMDDCAYDWAMHFNAASIGLYKEFGGIIYKDDEGYYWGGTFIGNDKEVYWSIPKVREGVAFIHSHGGGKPSLTDAMSRQDKQMASKMQRPHYMVDSGGNLYVLDPFGNNKQTKVREGLPVDCQYVDMTQSRLNMCVYFNNNYQDLCEYDIGYIADYYNKMYMRGEKYYDYLR